jgi:hypothetical protein
MGVAEEVDVTECDLPKTGLSGGGQATLGVRSRGDGEVVH